MPVSRSLRVSVHWYLGYGGLHAYTFDRRTGRDEEGLPREAARFYERLSEWAVLVRDHYVTVDQVDVTAGWRDDDIRRSFVAEADELQSEIKQAMGTGWFVDVSPEPGLARVTLAGEYGCDWPLWVAGGLSGPDDWPMLSPAIVERLGRWALQAEPDHRPPPDPVTTATLRRDLARELGDRFRVTV